MRFTKVHIENFRSIETADVRFHPIVTGIIGKNNTGKSSVLQALESLALLHSQAGFAWKDLFRRVVRGGNTDLEMRIEAEVKLSTSEAERTFSENLLPLLAEDQVRVLLRVVITSGEIALEMMLRVGDEERGIQSLVGSTSFGIDDVLRAAGLAEIGGVTFESKELVKICRGVAMLSSSRASTGATPAKRQEVLYEDASNLAGFLLTLLSTDRIAYERIVATLRKLVPEVRDLVTPLEESEAVLRLYDRAYPALLIGWEDVATGTRQLVHLMAFAARVDVMLVEEPELSLHPDALVRVIEALSAMCSEGDKQVICTTHAPALIDALPLEQVRVTRRGANGTQIRDMTDFKAIERRIRQTGLSLGPLLATSGSRRSRGKAVMIVEGRSDLLVWRTILERSGVDLDVVQVLRSNGWQDACSLAQFVGFLEEIGIHSLGYILVLDSDGDRETKIAAVKERGLDAEKCFVLQEKELESYLTDADAIAKVTGRAEEDVVKTIKQTKGRGKERLKKILKTLGVRCDSGILQALALNLARVPDELVAVAQRAKAMSE